MQQTTKNSRLIEAPAERIYQAFASPEMLIKWQVPGNMTARMHYFDFREGGGYEMSLFYPEGELHPGGKSAAQEDRFFARFTKLVPGSMIREAIRFDTPDPAFSGEMILEVSLTPVGTGTEVTFLFKNIPVGIHPEDNEAGTASSLEKLASLVET